MVNWLNNQFHAVLLWLDSVVYWFASECYQLFIKLASARIFEDEFFANFANRIYAVLGVFMLFYLAYSLLTALIDPEKLTKGDKGVSKIAINIVTSLVIIGFLPSIFTYAYRLQNYILSSNLIGSLILGTPVVNVNASGGDENAEVMLKYGDVLSFSVLNTFLNSENINVNLGANSNKDYNWFDLKYDILTNSDYSKMIGLNVAVSTGSNEVLANGSTGNLVIVDYKPFLSTAAGVFLIYIMISFTIDLGIRVVKLAFYQLIAPIPVIMRAIPGKKSTFDKYLKQVLSLFCEVFLKVGAMYMAIYFINEIVNSNTLKQFWDGGIQGKLALAIIMMGILVCAKEIPKMLGDLLGIDTKGLKLGLGEKLKAGGFFAAGSAAGALIASRGNPLAAGRAFRAGLKDGSFNSMAKTFGTEANRYRINHAPGTTFRGRMTDSLRGALGFDTTFDAMNRRIEEMPYTDENGNRQRHTENVYDANGNIVGQRDVEVDKNYMGARKQELQDRTAHIDEEIRKEKEYVERNQEIIDARKKMQDEAEKRIMRNDSSIVKSLQRELKDSNGNVIGYEDMEYGPISGNYQELEKFIKEQDLGRHPEIDAFKRADGTIDNDAYNAAVTEHAKIIQDYRKALDRVKLKMQDDYINAVLDPNNTEINWAPIQNAWDKMMGDISHNEEAQAQMASLGINDVTSAEEMNKLVLKGMLKVNNAHNANINNYERNKRPAAQEMAELNRIEAIHKSQQDTAKLSDEYRHAEANKNARNQNGGGSR